VTKIRAFFTQKYSYIYYFQLIQEQKERNLVKSKGEDTQVVANYGFKVYFLTNCKGNLSKPIKKETTFFPSG